MYWLLRLLDLAEDEDLLLRVPVDAVRVVEEVPEHLGVVRVGMIRASSAPLSRISW